MRATAQTAATLPTQNDTWGFWGTMDQHAATAWPLAFTAVQTATGAEFEAVRAFLDSRYGRHFADDVLNGLHRGQDLAAAVASAVTTWMGWRIGRQTSRSTGIPQGWPHLVGYVHQAELEAEAA